jgi:hypothetical protein
VREREGWGGGGEYRQKQGREIRAPNERLAGKAAWGASCALYYPNYIYYIYIYIYVVYDCVYTGLNDSRFQPCCVYHGGRRLCVCVCVGNEERKEGIIEAKGGAHGHIEPSEREKEGERASCVLLG